MYFFYIIYLFYICYSRECNFSPIILIIEIYYYMEFSEKSSFFKFNIINKNPHDPLKNPHDPFLGHDP